MRQLVIFLKVLQLYRHFFVNIITVVLNAPREGTSNTSLLYQFGTTYQVGHSSNRRRTSPPSQNIIFCTPLPFVPLFGIMGYVLLFRESEND